MSTKTFGLYPLYFFIQGQSHPDSCHWRHRGALQLAVPLLILRVRWGWLVNSTLRPPYSRERDTFPIYMRQCGPQGWSGREFSSLPGFEPRTIRLTTLSRPTFCFVHLLELAISSIRCTNNELFLHKFRVL
jgi:hypothetical protein